MNKTKTEKNKKQQEKRVHICPNCGSLDLQSALTIGPQKLNSYIVENNKQFEGIPINQDTFLCKKCKFLNIFPKVKTKNIKKFREDLKKHKKQPLTPKRKPLTKFQIIFSTLLIIWFVIGTALYFTEITYAERYFVITAPLIFLTWLIWIIYRTFKKN